MEHRAWLAVIACALAGVALGCGGPDAAVDSQVDTSYQALSGQVLSCVATARACLKDANCDQTQVQACRDGFASCRDDARAAAEAFHQAVHQCMSNARECKTSTDGGTDARQQCRDTLHMCVADARPPQAEPPPCLASLRDCLQADNADVKQCLMDAHQCFLDGMPPRCGDAGVGGAFGNNGQRQNFFGSQHNEHGFAAGGRSCPDGGLGHRQPPAASDAGMPGM